MKKILGKWTVLLLTIGMMLCCAGCGGDTKNVADYNSPQSAIEAYQSGTDIMGKTMSVTASMDSSAGVIYFEPVVSLNANVYVVLITEDADDLESETGDILKGDTVTVQIDGIDNHLKNSIYLFGKRQ